MLWVYKTGVRKTKVEQNVGMPSNGDAVRDVALGGSCHSHGGGTLTSSATPPGDVRQRSLPLADGTEISRLLLGYTPPS